MSAAGRLKSIGLSAAIAILGGAAILFVAEVVLRGSGVEPRGYVIVDEDTCFIAWGPSTHDEAKKHGTELVHRVWTDENGFRTRDGKAKPAAKCRVIAAGDSFTHGQYVDADEAYPAVVERVLTQRGLRVEVDNGGMPGDTIAEERIAVLGRWGHLGSAVVVVGHTANDLEDLLVLKRGGCRIGGPVPTEFQPALSDPVKDLRVLRVSQDVAARLKMLSPRMRSIRSGMRDLSPPASAEECAAAERAYLDLALDLTNALRAKGTKLLLALHEGFFCGGSARDAFEGELTRRLGEAGARVVDVKSAVHAPGASLRPVDGHPSPKGHRLLGEGIAQALADSGWLDGCR